MPLLLNIKLGFVLKWVHLTGLFLVKLSYNCQDIPSFPTCYFHRRGDVPGSLISVKREPTHLVSMTLFVQKGSHFSDKNKLVSLFYITFPEIAAANLKCFGRVCRKIFTHHTRAQELLELGENIWPKPLQSY